MNALYELYLVYTDRNYYIWIMHELMNAHEMFAGHV